MNGKIMVVDDNHDFVYTIKKGLERLKEGYKVIGVTSGNECFEILKNQNIPDLILLDIMMPGMSGWDVFAKLKENSEWRKIPVVFLTAKTDSFSKGFGKITAQDYIEKPFEIMDLKKRIDKVLSR